VKADAKQIEYRLFGHYANSPAINERYRRNPETDFHEIVQEMIRPFRAIDRQDAKNVNFAKLYGSAAAKLSRMLNISVEEAQELINIYDAAIPEARDLMKKAMSLVKARGYVKTILGRKARFKKVKGPAWYNPDIIIEEYDRIYSALNRAIQGSAADIMKMKLLEVYNNRKLLDFHMFFTVHDDVNGDVGSVEAAKKLEELLNEQIAELKLRIPILWDVSVGENWAEAA
jgi:DNA polymerase-1